MSAGLVIGKFLPPHGGHAHLIGRARGQVDRLTVILFSKRAEPIPGAVRERWMRELFPAVDLRHVAEEHPVDFEDAAAWDFWVGAIRRALPAAPDLVFSSEEYGEELARRLGARHVMVDRERRAVPVSGTQLRARPMAGVSFALEKTGLKVDHIDYTIGTGYGRVNVPMAQQAITEITCHARGANFMYGPEVRTVMDMGGQDCKAISTDERGKVLNFIMNVKCAAGTGRGMEVFADLIRVPVWEIGPRSFSIPKEPPMISTTCVVFAKSEVIGLLEAGTPENEIMAAYCAAMAHRIMELLNRLGVKEKFVITGGIAKKTKRHPSTHARLMRLQRSMRIGLPSITEKPTGCMPATGYSSITSHPFVARRS